MPQDYAEALQWYQLAADQGITLIQVGDRDAFTVNVTDLTGHDDGPFDGVVIVHPAAAMQRRTLVTAAATVTVLAASLAAPALPSNPANALPSREVLA